MRYIFLASWAVIAAAAHGGVDPAKVDTPGVVALSEASPGHWVFRQFPSLSNLYIRDQDIAGGKSTCVIKDGCAAAWPPLVAADGEKPVGDWTIIEREFDRKQWAYKGKPVYLRYHDLPGNGAEEGFRLLVP